MMRLMLACAACGVVLGGCERGAERSASAPGVAEPAGGAAWVLTGEPAGAVGVAEVKASAQEGDTVVLRGRIGGRRDPMGEGSAVFTVMDLGLPHCGENPEDKCATPWDYCCEKPETIRANAATVQAPAAADGAGFRPLDEVVVVGTVGPRPNPDVLTVVASGVYRVGP